MKGTRQLHRFVPHFKLLVYTTSLQASSPTEGIIAKSISLSRVQIEDNTLQIGSFVTCTYDKKWWLGMVAQVSDEFGDHKINFMHLSGPGKQSHLPTKVDTCWSSNIVCVIEAPVLSSSSSRKYIISENDYKKITKAYDMYLCIILYNIFVQTYCIYTCNITLHLNLTLYQLPFPLLPLLPLPVNKCVNYARGVGSGLSDLLTGISCVALLLSGNT